jgi:hypothetical protein
MVRAGYMTRPVPARLLPPLLAALALLDAAPAAAQEEEAERLIRQGVGLRRAGKDAEALPLFQRAYELFPTSRAGAQLGFAEAAVGMSVEAERHVSAALADEGDPWVRRNKTTIVRALAEIRAELGRLVIEVVPATATVTVNGQAVPASQLGRPLAVKRGSAVIEARQPGFEREVRTVAVIPGATERVAIELPRVAGTGAGAALARPAPDQALSGGEPLPARGGAGTGRRVGAFALLSAGVVAVVGGASCAWIAGGKIDAIEKDARAGNPYQISNGNFTTYNTLARVLFVAGGASLAGGGWLLWSARQQPGPPRTVGLTPTLLGGAPGALVAGSF